MSQQWPPGVLANTANNITLRLEIAKSFEEAVRTCGSPDILALARYLPNTHLLFHTLAIYLTGAFGIITILLSLYLITIHLLHWVRPAEQRQVFRILLYPLLMSLASFVSTYYYGAEGYIHPWAIYYEGFAMTGLFLLYVQLCCPTPTDRAQYFQSLQRKWMNGKTSHDRGSLRWFRIIWCMVFQITFTRILTVVGSVVLTDVTCPLQKARANWSIAIQVVQGVSTFVAVFGVVMFEKRMHEHLDGRGHRPFLKLVAFKGVVGLEATQAILFSVIAEQGVFFPKPPYSISWSDFAVGIPQLILSFEMMVVSIVFLRAFSPTLYKNIARDGGEKGAPVWKAALQAFDVRDIWRGAVFTFTCWRTSSEYMQGRVDGRAVEGHPEVTDERDLKGGSQTPRRSSDVPLPVGRV